jgi:phospholipid/cholesterol/gamma-HCH transport system permease protein
MTLVLRNLGAAALMLAHAAQTSRRGKVRWKEVLRQLDDLGTRSLWLISMGLAFFGGVVVLIAWAQARKYTGNVTVVGAAYFQLMVRELAPLTAALLAAARLGAGTSAELASMSVNEQLEAMELSAADPVRELVTPRVIASMIAVPLLTIVGTVSATLAAAAMLNWYFGVDGKAFMDPRFVEKGDVLCALVKSVICGAYIPIAAAVRGMRAQAGAGAVGEAVTSGVVDACMGVLLIDFFIALAFRFVGL